MILKLRTVDEGWVYYNINQRVKVRRLTKEQYENGISDNTPNRVEIDLEGDGFKNKSYYIYSGVLKVIRFKDIIENVGDIIIYTNLAAYLLNDEGKTIERLN